LATAQQPLWWEYGGQLVGSGTVSPDRFGTSLSLSGNDLAVGAPRADHLGTPEAGAVFLYERSGTSWVERARLTADDFSPLDQFGHALVLRGDTLAVGAFNGNAAYVCERSGTSWFEAGKLTSADLMPGDWFGAAIALSGDTIVVSAAWDKHAPGMAGGSGEGAAYVFVRSGSSWVEQAKLTASDAELFDWFGHYVAISGDTVVVGASFDEHAPGLNGSLNGPGSAYVFVRTGTTWSEQAKLTASDALSRDRFGAGVTVDGDTAVIGAHADAHAPGAIGGSGPGSAYVFVRSGTTWTQTAKLAAGDAQMDDSFGRTLELEQNTLVIGSLNDNINLSTLNAGAAYFFELGSSGWQQKLKVVAETREATAQFGTGVAVGYPYAAFGSPGEGGGGSAYVYDARDSCATCATYCTAGTSSNGCTARIWAYGSPSASASDGFLVVGSHTGNKNGMFFFAANGQQTVPWGSGTSYQCVVPPVKRAGLLNGFGTTKSCDGTFTQDLNTLWSGSPHKNPGSGAVVQAQLWVRDPNNTSNKKTVMSDALELTVGP
jgi:hypothetical protein